ncbi:hypothetical protein H257_05941 [Aphanomyces astaci]|uniref:Uncharacterized protein n=1 Tax=Aphanomyces astaci TaxID=112090 RepID=W4GQ03_APHAT|nr:hypothetical protein H257_05941 [Aphanomyces astaci]ETV81411.1 hypothetical protein H257_05941 [Aphanomyces astaci]|eukprot:XP_009829269.1 hypothetical protein H257_05941 [Aphanomyces astaci]
MKLGLVVGLDGAGKTMLLRQLSRMCKDEFHNPKLGSVFEKVRTRLFADSAPAAEVDGIDVATLPTTGVEEETIAYRNLAVTLREVGAPMLSMWKSYFESCDFFMFVVDMTNFPQLAAAAVEFFNVVQAPAMQSKGCAVHRVHAMVAVSLQPRSSVRVHEHPRDSDQRHDRRPPGLAAHDDGYEAPVHTI